MDFIRTKDLGYNPNNIIRTAIWGDEYQKAISFAKNEFAKEPSITMASFGSDGTSEDMYVNDRVFKGIYKSIDENFLAVLDIPLKAGQNFEPVSGNNKHGVIVNEAFARVAGLQHPIGAAVEVNRYYDSSLKVVIGVVKDFSILDHYVSP